jgi:hypothetical protein
MKRTDLVGLAEIFARNPDLAAKNRHIARNGSESRFGASVPSASTIHRIEVEKPVPQTRKYRNQPVEVDGVRFDSKKEASRWVELQYWERAGFIRDLERQVPFVLEVNGTRIGKYVADFRYLDITTGQVVVEDVKSEATRKLPVYRMKKKLMFALYQVVIRET